MLIIQKFVLMLCSRDTRMILGSIKIILPVKKKNQIKSISKKYLYKINLKKKK
jgi:hypothetical protein